MQSELYTRRLFTNEMKNFTKLYRFHKYKKSQRQYRATSHGQHHTGAHSKCELSKLTAQIETKAPREPECTLQSIFLALSTRYACLSIKYNFSFVCLHGCRWFRFLFAIFQNDTKLKSLWNDRGNGWLYWHFNRAIWCQLAHCCSTMMFHNVLMIRWSKTGARFNLLNIKSISAAIWKEGGEKYQRLCYSRWSAEQTKKKRKNTRTRTRTRKHRHALRWNMWIGDEMATNEK